MINSYDINLIWQLSLGKRFCERFVFPLRAPRVNCGAKIKTEVEKEGEQNTLRRFFERKAKKNALDISRTSENYTWRGSNFKD